MALKVKLVKSWASRPQDHRDTVFGLGLNRLGSERILKDTPQIRGMIAKVSHLVSVEEIKGDAPKRDRKASARKNAAKASRKEA